MTERILGEPGPTRRRRLRLLLPLLALTVLIVVLGAPSAGALDTTSPPTFTYVKDEDCSKTPACADDQPGQKDLSAHAVANPAPNDLWVSWKWDVTSLSGGNTGDACALFDTDQSGTAGAGRVDFSVCVTIANSPAAQVVNLSPRIYTCGDAKVDRCTSTVALVPKPYGTACSVQQSGIDNSDPWHSGQTDTVAVCHIDLADVGGASASKLVNTCSYPSEQPNSDPSDCVLIPRDAFLKIIKNAGGETTNFNFSVSGGATATPTIAGGSNTTIAIKSSTSTNVTEALPSSEWEFVSANCLNGAGAAVGTLDNTAPDFGRTGFSAASDETITCTFTNALKAAPQLKITKSCVSKHAAADRFQPQNGGSDVGSALDCGESTTISLSPNTAYSITEVGSAGANLANYETPSYSSACSSASGLARGAATPECIITNTLKLFKLIVIVCDGAELHSSAVTLPQGQNSTNTLGAAPAGVSEVALCGSAGASYSRKSGTYSPEVVINP